MTRSSVRYFVAIAIVASLGCSPVARPVGVATGVDEAGPNATEPLGASEAPVADLVTLSGAKLAAAGIDVRPAAVRPLPDERTVPGRLNYDERRHVAVRAPTGGVVVGIRVKPGDSVAAGQSLAVISSPELGEVRADEMKRLADWQFARRNFERDAEIDANLQPFVAAIRQRLDPIQLDRQFRSSVLGPHRERLVAASARLVLADSLLKNADSVSSAGILAGRAMVERTSERQAADAAFVAACEQSLFEARLNRDQAAAAAADSERRLQITRQQLRSLLGYELATPQAGESTDLSQIEIRAPFGGTIEDQMFSPSERIQANDELFTLADTTRLWVVADVRENDWPATRVQPGAEMSVRVPAIPGREFGARVHYVGRRVDTDSNALSVVAEVENPDGQLRPGLFVHASLSVGMGDPVLAVPAVAIATHERATFVFVQESAGSFRRVPVAVGRQTSDWVEVRSGLTAGDLVVVSGTFALKSELLLEPEE